MYRAVDLAGVPDAIAGAPARAVPERCQAGAVIDHPLVADLHLAGLIADGTKAVQFCRPMASRPAMIETFTNACMRIAQLLYLWGFNEAPRAANDFY